MWVEEEYLPIDAEATIDISEDRAHELRDSFSFLSLSWGDS